MKLVILESPFAGDVEANIEYARACVRDSLPRGFRPFYTLRNPLFCAISRSNRIKHLRLRFGEGISPSQPVLATQLLP